MIANIVKLNHELSTLRTEKQESAALIVTLKAEKDHFEEAKSKYEEEKAKVEEKLKGMEEEVARLKAKLEEEEEEGKKETAALVTAVAETVDAKVVQKLAAIGVAEGTVKEEVAAPVTEDPAAIYAKFETLQGSEKINFFKTHERVILKGMRAAHYRPVDVTKANMRSM